MLQNLSKLFQVDVKMLWKRSKMAYLLWEKDTYKGEKLAKENNLPLSCLPIGYPLVINSSKR